MKRLALTIVAGAFGTLLALPLANAQDMSDTNSAATVQSEHSVDQKTTETQQNYPDGAASDRQVNVEKHSDVVQNGDMGTSTQKQVDVEKRSEVQSGAFGPVTTEKQVDVQKRSVEVNGGAPATDTAN